MPLGPASCLRQLTPLVNTLARGVLIKPTGGGIPAQFMHFCITKMTFKLIVSGVTGRIGKHVLNRALHDPSITSVIALSRRPLPDVAQHPKARVIVLEDFKVYTDDVIAELADADGAIWYCACAAAATPC